MRSCLVLCTFAILGSSPLLADDTPPRALDPRLEIRLFAEQPQIVTPAGLDVDSEGRVWAIESNTHFRPDDYQGHPTDRVLVMSDTDGDGKADRILTFTDGLTHAMSVAIRPVWLPASRERQRPESSDKNPSANHSPLTTHHSPTTSVYIATRKEILLFHDDDGDLKADRRERLVHLDTPGNYPHNGLAGFAFDPLGWMYFGFGENLGAEYKLIGADGTTLSGGGEGGSLYRCRPDGTQLSRWATGFWNPHASCFDAFGRMFTVDNDPDSRPPCRLLHIIPDGDYGYRFRNGRKGLHPFTSWNGEIPGTLPMVAGTGEAPSGIVAYEADGLPEEYLGTLLVTSWGDHRLDRFRLKPKGASFESLAETIIQGGEDFRPVGIALAPDGSLYLTDWVKRDYKLHGHGRVWRVAKKEEPISAVTNAAGITPNTSINELLKLLDSATLNVRRAAAQRLSLTVEGRRSLLVHVANRKNLVRSRIEAYWAQVKRATEEPLPEDLIEAVPEVLGDAKPEGAWSELETAMAWVRNEKDLQDATFVFRRASAAFPLFDALQPKKDNVGRIAGLFNRFPPEDLPNWPFQSENFETHVQDPFVYRMYCLQLSRARQPQTLRNWWEANREVAASSRTMIVLAARLRGPQDSEIARLALEDPDAPVLRAAVQWIAEENLKELRPQVEAILDKPQITTDLFLATLAALEMLDGKPPAEFEKTPPAKYVLPMIGDEKRSPAVRAQALRLVAADDPAITADVYRSLLNASDPALKQEAVRTLRFASRKFVGGLLLPIATDKNAPLPLRADAVAGLAGRWSEDESAGEVSEALKELALWNEPALQLEAVRAARNLLTKTAAGRATRTALVRQLEAAQAADARALQPGGSHRELAEQLALALTEAEIALPNILKPVQTKRPTMVSEWYEQVTGTSGDAAAGRRVFFHSQWAGCARCHTVNGRGGQVGPDLSVIARTMDRKKLAESVLEPSKELSPQFTTWTFVMKTGQVHTGMLLGDTREGRFHIGTSDGTVVELSAYDVDERRPQTVSLMPEKLIDRLTVGEFRDLLAFLETLK